MKQPMRYLQADFLLGHVSQTMAFYHPHCIDKDGGFFHYFKDNGQVYNPTSRHLVSSTRFVFNYAMAAMTYHRPEDLEQVIHGLNYLEQAHFNPATGGYIWLLEGATVVDDTNHAYGLAFVLLANAVALKAGIESPRPTINRIWTTLETHFWDPTAGLYKDECNGDFSQTSPYRGQNANMHLCEALLMTYEATGNNKYLDRAYTLAYNMTVRQAALAGGLVWEHYTSDWQIDWDYNKDDPKHLFRPWGFQPGHQTEWTKLLLILHRHRPESWMVDKAQYLFDTAMQAAWDNEHGGICYGFDPQHQLCDTDKYFWVQAESFAAAALLALATDQPEYWQWYERIWEYSWQHMIDHRHGAWYRILDRQNGRYNDEKSPAGKTDYHTMGACYEVLRALQLDNTTTQGDNS